MSIRMILLPVFVHVALTFVLLAEDPRGWPPPSPCAERDSESR